MQQYLHYTKERTPEHSSNTKFDVEFVSSEKIGSELEKDFQDKTTASNLDLFDKYVEWKMHHI